MTLFLVSLLWAFQNPHPNHGIQVQEVEIQAPTIEEPVVGAQAPSSQSVPPPQANRQRQPQFESGEAASGEGEESGFEYRDPVQDDDLSEDIESDDEVDVEADEISPGESSEIQPQDADLF